MTGERVTPSDPGADDGGIDVSVEQLAHLLEFGTEAATRDYKVSCDLTMTRDCAEIAKDIGAMQILGGYMVIGADDTGTPVPPGVPPDQVPLWDEARLRPKLAKWLPEPFELHTAAHTYEDTTLVVVHVGRNRSGLCVFKADGQYPKDGGGTATVFRSGDVFARHGTSSERWCQDDIDNVIDALVEDRKERWRADLAGDMAAIGAAQTAQTLAGGPIGNLSWKVDADTFDSAVLELFRSDDDIALRSFIISASNDARALVETQNWTELETLVARLTSMAANAITYRRIEWFGSVLDALAGLYKLGFDQRGFDRHDIAAPNLWLLLLENLLGLGAVAVRAEDWDAVAAIALREPGDATGHYRSWLRHGLTMASRANLLNDGGDSKSLLTVAQDRVATNPALRAALGDDPDSALTALCQFDLLAAVTAMGATGNVNDRDWYPNFARFFTSRSEPVVVKLLRDPAMRQKLFPLDEDTLAEALRVLSATAGTQSFRFNGWFHYDSPEVERFLRDHPAAR